MGATYAGYRTQLSPPELLNTFGSKYETAIGTVQDNQITRVRQAVLSRFPDSAPSDALAFAGQERQIFRGPNEVDAAFAARLQQAMPSWQAGGTDVGVLAQLYGAGFTNCAIIDNNGPGAGAAGTPGWVSLGGVPPDGETSKWARYWLAIGQPPVMTGFQWGVPASPWNTKTAYLVGQTVTYGGEIYSCTVANTGSAPPSADWAALETAPSSTTAHIWNEPNNGAPLDLAWGFGAVSDFGTPPPTPLNVINLVRQIVGVWGAAHALCMGVWFINTGSPVGPPLSGGAAPPASPWLEENAFFATAGDSTFCRFRLNAPHPYAPLP